MREVMKFPPDPRGEQLFDLVVTNARARRPDNP